MNHVRFNHISRAIAFGALAISSLLGSLNAQIRYRIVAPEVFGNEINQTEEHGNEINDLGESILNRVASFAVWQDGAATHVVNALTSYPASISKVNAASINEFQQVVGSKTYRVRTESGTQLDTFPFYWDPYNGMVDLDDIGERSATGVGNTSLYRINREGIAIGVTQKISDENAVSNIAFAWSFESGRHDIAPLSETDGISYTKPLDINNAGSIVGNFRKFEGSLNRYYENGFILPSDGSPIGLADFDPKFFGGSHSTARSINAVGNFSGEIDGKAYFYDVKNAKGELISHPANNEKLTKGYSVNDFDVLAGTLETRDRLGKLGMMPFIWTRELGVIDLSSQLKKGLATLLPETIDPNSVRITPKTINNRGQISARLETDSQFAREVLLEPALDFEWHSMSQTVLDGVQGALYIHQKSEAAADSIPIQALGYEIGFECSADMVTWTPVESDKKGIRITEDEHTIEVFVPFRETVFIKPVLAQESEV